MELESLDSLSLDNHKKRIYKLEQQLSEAS
jgi:hypothetical protein